MPATYEIRLADGRIIALCSLFQSHTYDGLIEGLPTVEMNRRIIDATVADATARWGHLPLLIEPVETPITIGRSYPFGTPAAIPPIQCVSRWTSGFESRGELDGFVELTIIFYQHGFAMPIARDNLARIEACDWDRLSSLREI